MATVFTIGHSTRSLDELTALLREQAIDVLVDVRTIPRSRRHPQFNAEALAETMPAAGIVYRGEKALGGLRGKRKEPGPSPNGFWTNTSFRNYADYALSQPFRSALAELEALAGARRPAIMCAEVLWWRCHRRIITDYLLADGFDVVHILAPGKTEPAKLTPAAVKIGNGALHYPAAPESPRLPGL